jgi:predicted nucleic acid-binding protein
MTTVIDTNVLIYLTDRTSPNHKNAEVAFNRCKLKGAIVLTDMAYSEYSVGMKDKEATDYVVAQLALDRVSMSDEALFEAGRVFLNYRARGGGRQKPLPDHYIAAHAKTIGATLLTNNVADYNHVDGLTVEGI